MRAYLIALDPHDDYVIGYVKCSSINAAYAYQRMWEAEENQYIPSLPYRPSTFFVSKIPPSGHLDVIDVLNIGVPPTWYVRTDHKATFDEIPF